MNTKIALLIILPLITLTACTHRLARIATLAQDKLQEQEATETTTTTTTTTTQPSAAFIYQWAWGEGFKAPNAMRDPAVTITIKRVDKGGIWFDATDFSHWPSAGVLSAPHKDRAVACLVYIERGKAAKFDWCPEATRQRDWKHVTTKHYGGMPSPASKERCGFVLVSSDRTRCSNIVEFDWPF